MSAASQPPRWWQPRGTLSGWLARGPRTVVLRLCIIALLWAVSGSIYVHPSVRYQVRCVDSGQCVVTIRNAGGGFDHGFNPAYSWVITATPLASLRFSATSGTVQAYHSAQVRIVVASGSCPTSITITGTHDIVNLGPYRANTQTGQCILVAPVVSRGI